MATVCQPPLVARREPLALIGDWMARHRGTILAVQWGIIFFYLALVTIPAFLPYPSHETRVFSSDAGAVAETDPASCAAGITALFDPSSCFAVWRDRLVLLAQYLFWGVWWPFVILSTMLLGRFWCGVLCPEGALTEFASRHGRGGAIPKWLRWSGWPVVAFIITTLYGQLVSVYDYAAAALLILGGSTLAAIAVGLLFGRGKRVWCRYLCPVSGVFALLARLAPVHFRADRDAWDRHTRHTAAVDCAPLLDVKHLRSAAQCHACGRCSGHRDAVALSARSPNREVLAGPPATTPEALLLVFGVLGVAIGAFQWSVNPWFITARQRAAEWLVNHDELWPLGDSPAWWLLTRHPEVNDVFLWLDGFAILAYIAAVAAVVGGGTYLCVRGAARLAGDDWRRLALGLTPLGGIGLFLGLSMMTVTHLRAEGIPLPALDELRAVLLALGLGWSAWLGLNLLRQAKAVGRARLLAAFVIWLVPLTLIDGSWVFVFYVW